MGVNDLTSPESLQRLIATMRAAQVTDLRLEQGRQSVRLRLAPQATAAAPRPETAHPVKARAFGRLRLADPDFALPAPGDCVAMGAILAFVETGDLRLALRAPLAGRLSAPLADEGAIIGFDQHIFDIHAIQGEQT
ncbi:hypothetical protein A8A54_19040 [Brucella pseudogrignonensis]|uniref:hypothetical protein n=1 Tax=Brucella pseudogrignonensis TaxID=419475 RepID=UPI0007DA566F|nr:hypothetical protein [Brucella pseudogrignonensis]ANG98705.1 hypothetical protein A8A54_19040 [Brucella pseudogrignonensis]